LGGKKTERHRARFGGDPTKKLKVTRKIFKEPGTDTKKSKLWGSRKWKNAGKKGKTPRSQLGKKKKGGFGKARGKGVGSQEKGKGSVAALTHGYDPRFS